MTENSRPADSCLDLVIVGAGLSGSRVFVELVARLRRVASQKPLKIAMIDRLGAFGRGAPYGEHVPAGFLLIEDAASSTPLEFQQWLRGKLLSYAEAVDAAGTPDSSLLSWVRTNRSRIEAADLGELFVPRRWFGDFSAECLREAIQSAADLKCANTTLVSGECIDVEPIARASQGGYRVQLADGRCWETRCVVLAAGCIARENSFGLSADDGYLHDLYDSTSGFGELEHVLNTRVGGSGSNLDLLIIGSNASSIEVIYFLAHRHAGSLRSIRVVSGGGYLPGQKELPADGSFRPSAREYVQAASTFIRENRLVATSAKVSQVTRNDGRLRVHLECSNGLEQVEADVVINCSGAGRLNKTGSRLFNKLFARRDVFKPDQPTLKCFRSMPSRVELEELPGCFVIGPIQNDQRGVKFDVESIGAVYEMAPQVAEALSRRILDGK